jgi:hypothetical protein
MNHGDDEEYRFRHLDSNKVPVDLTGWTINLEALEPLGVKIATIADQSIDETGEEVDYLERGHFYFTITRLETSVVARRIKYEMVFWDSNGNKDTVWEGKIKVRQEVR